MFASCTYASSYKRSVHTRHDEGMDERLHGVGVQGSSNFSELAERIKTLRRNTTMYQYLGHYKVV